MDACVCGRIGESGLTRMGEWVLCALVMRPGQVFVGISSSVRCNASLLGSSKRANHSVCE